MKTADNKDFEDLYKIYTESSCAYNKKPEDDEEDEDKKVVEEESEEEDEEDGDVVEEGIWDRTKARAAGVKDAMGASATHMKKAFGGAKHERAEDVGSKFEKGKSYSIMNSHAVKLDKQLSSLVTDATKLGIMDAGQAEKWAIGISKQIHSVLTKLAGNKKFSDKGKKNF